MTEDPFKSDLKKNADTVIRNHMAWSMGMGLIPVPIVDFFAVSAIQLDMVRQLCKLYEVDFRENDVKAIVSSLSGSGLARLGAQAVKFIPGVGSVWGGITMSVLSGATTYAIGGIFKKHFETGGTALDFDMERLKKIYNELFEKGKKEAVKMKKEQDNKASHAEASDGSSGQDSDKTIERLKELSDLRTKGIITDEEFVALKKKLIEE